MNRRLALGIFLSMISMPIVSATYFDDIGYTELKAELTALDLSIPNGSGVSVLQVETLFGANSYYRPDANDSQYTTITFDYLGVTTPAGVSNHSTRVGRYFYGNTMSLTPGITNVAIMAVDLGSPMSDFLGHLGLNSPYFGNVSDQWVAPANLSAYKVQNHAWVYTLSPTIANYEILNRLDYMINRDNVLSVVGVSNGSTPELLLASSYNSLSVGLTTGAHAWATTGHQSPQIVAPNTEYAVSFSMGLVSSAGTLLVDAASSSHLNMPAAQNSVVLRAMLLAGATKSEFANWSRASESRPLDNQFGAGELNIYNSYEILAAGQQTASTNSLVSKTGWAFDSISQGESDYYYFDLTTISSLAVSLNWNVEYAPIAGSYSDMQELFSQLDLYLYSADENFVLDSVYLQRSISSENLEYLWLAELGPGRYAIRVDALTVLGDGLIDYGLAWQSITVPEPSVAMLLLMGGILIGYTRRSVRA